jgi:hypothetical protein
VALTVQGCVAQLSPTLPLLRREGGREGERGGQASTLHRTRVWKAWRAALHVGPPTPYSIGP